MNKNMKKRKIKAVFFDIDNTLYDSKTLSQMARRNSVIAMIDAGLKVSFDRAMKKLNEIIEKYGANYPKHYNKLLESFGIKSHKIVAAGVVAYEKTKHAYLRPFPGVVPALLELKKNYRLGIISNGLAIKQWEKLINLNLHHFFDVVITSEEAGYEKPDKKIFEIALKEIKAEPGEAVMIGDKEIEDIKGAKSIGMHAINIKALKNFSEIIREIKKLEM